MRVRLGPKSDEWDVGRLIDEVELHGVRLPRGTELCWDADFPILYATLARPLEFRGQTLPAGCRFEFSTPSFGFPGLAIPLWFIPFLILYGLYRLVRWILLGTGPWSVQLYFPTEDGRPDPAVARYDVGPRSLLPVARVVK